jgi:tripartite-type tricarboxylate transporter receptor subunit TctC
VGGAQAQDYPSKPVRIVVGYPPGGANDLVARQLAPRVGEAIGGQVVVENRPGASAVIGSDHVAKSAPDGHTLGFVSLSPLVLAPITLAKVPYDSVRDFAPITMVAMAPMMIAVHPSLPARSLKELTALAEARPGQLDIALSGSIGLTRMVLELYKLTAGVRIQHVVYKGAAPALTEVVGGHVHGIVEALPVIAPHVQRGALRGVAVASERRSPSLPDLPTTVEQGMPTLLAVNWFGLVAPAKTPAPVVRKLYAAFAKAAGSAEQKAQFQAAGLEHMVSASPEAFAAVVKDDLVRWSRIAKSAGIRPE